MDYSKYAVIIAAFLFLLSSAIMLMYIRESSSSFPINASAQKDCGKACDSGNTPDSGSGNTPDSGVGEGGTGSQSDCPKEDRGPNGICSHTENIPFTEKCPQGTSEVISNGERFCIPPGPGENQACPGGVLTQNLGCRPAEYSNSNNTNLTFYNGTTPDVFGNGTLTINKIISTTKKLIPDPSYLITPNPYTLNKSLLVYDNDKNDFNRTKGVVVLKNITYSPYIIQEVIPYRTHYYILHEAPVSVNERLPNPVLDIVEDNNLGKPLADVRIPFQYIVMLKDNVIDDPKSIADNFIAQGAELLHIYRYSFKGFALRIPNLGLLDEMVADSRIASIEQDTIGRIASTTAATIPLSSHQQTPTGLKRIDENIQSHSSTINQLLTIQESQNSTGTHSVDADIAILDTGISKSNPDLNVYRDVTFVKGTTSGDDDNGHGSHAAGTAAAKDNSLGVIGVAPGARLWAIKVCDGEGNCPKSNIIAGLDYVTKYADDIDVVNLSLEHPLDVSLDKAASKAVAAGLTVVAAAGNSGEDAKSVSPGHNPDVISVSAIADSDGKCGGSGRSTLGGADDRFANFSNYGPSVDIAAPGVDILSTYYNGELRLESGTSMAAPHVTGAAALYKSLHPLATPTEVRSALLDAASLPTAVCDGKSHGYFSGDADNFQEPLLYINNQQPAVGGEQARPIQPQSGFVATTNNQQPAVGGEQARPIQPQSGFIANDTSEIADSNHTTEHAR
jgi:subtilisin family serine protease